MTEPELTPYDEDLLSGHHSEAARTAMSIIVERDHNRRCYRESGNATHRPDNKIRAWMLLYSVELPVLKLPGRMKGILIRS